MEIAKRFIQKLSLLTSPVSLSLPHPLASFDSRGRYNSLPNSGNAQKSFFTSDEPNIFASFPPCVLYLHHSFILPITIFRLVEERRRHHILFEVIAALQALNDLQIRGCSTNSIVINSLMMLLQNLQNTPIPKLFKLGM